MSDTNSQTGAGQPTSDTGAGSGTGGTGTATAGTAQPAAGATPANPPAAPGTGGQPTAGQQDPPKAPAAAAAAPAQYTLTLPQDSPLDQSALERTATTARALGLSPEQAQQALEFVSQEVAIQREALLKAYQPGGAEWAKQVEHWKAATLADPALGKTPEERTAAVHRGQRVLQRYAELHPADAEAMTAFLNDSGLGNHPAAVRFFAWLGQAMSEGRFITGTGTGASESDRLAKLYPSMAHTS